MCKGDILSLLGFVLKEDFVQNIKVFADFPWVVVVKYDLYGVYNMRNIKY